MARFILGYSRSGEFPTASTESDAAVDLSLNGSMPLMCGG